VSGSTSNPPLSHPAILSPAPSTSNTPPSSSAIVASPFSDKLPQPSPSLDHTFCTIQPVGPVISSSPSLTLHSQTIASSFALAFAHFDLHLLACCSSVDTPTTSSYSSSSTRRVIYRHLILSSALTNSIYHTQPRHPAMALRTPLQLLNSATLPLCHTPRRVGSSLIQSSSLCLH
jgi:hypothetical protein